MLLRQAPSEDVRPETALPRGKTHKEGTSCWNQSSVEGRNLGIHFYEAKT